MAGIDVFNGTLYAVERLEVEALSIYGHSQSWPNIISARKGDRSYFDGASVSTQVHIGLHQVNSRALRGGCHQHDGIPTLHTPSPMEHTSSIPPME